MPIAASRQSSQADGHASPSARVAVVTPRAVLAGGLLVALLAAINPYIDFRSHIWHVGSGSLLQGPLVALLLLVTGNSLIMRVCPARAFTLGELLVVYSMGIVSIGLVRQGGLPYLVSAVAYPFYMASPSNRWAELIWPHIPSWMSPGGPAMALWFWEGAPGGVVPWSAWLPPMLMWGSFTVALMLAMLCLGALLSRDWIEKQRLTFPLVQVPLAVTGEGDRPTLRASLLTNRVFWIGAAIPAVFASLSWLHAVYPNVPAPDLRMIHIGAHFGGMPLPWNVLGDSYLAIDFLIIGVTFLIPADVSLSLWLFHLLFRLQTLVWASFGATGGGSTAASGIDPNTFIGFEEIGGFVALGAVCLYQSRDALRAAWRRVTEGRDEQVGPYEPMGPLAAVLGFSAASAFMMWWALRAGMSWWSFALIIGLFYAIAIGASRLVAAAGVIYVGTGIFPREAILRTVGAAALGPASLTMYSYLYIIYMSDAMNLAMPQMMTSFKLGRVGRLRGPSLTKASALAVVIVVVVGLAALLKLVHTYGASGAQSMWGWPFSSFSERAFGELETSLQSPEPADNWLRAATAIGAATTLLLTWLRAAFVWWPVSPVGFLIATSWPMRMLIWANVFVGWMLNRLVVRFGGLALFRRLRPAFLGLVLGDVFARAALAALAAALGVESGSWASA